MVQRRVQQLGGLFIALLGLGFTVWSWSTAFRAGYFYLKAALIFPAAFVIGLGLIVFPGYREERLARGEDIRELQGLKLFTPRWWGILVVALLAGLMNYLLLASLIER